MALERTFLFMGKGAARTSVTKALALCGIGEVRGAGNWDEAKRLEKEGKLNAWLAGKVEAGIELDELEDIQRGEENQRALAKVRAFARVGSGESDLVQRQCEAIFAGKTWQPFSQRSEAKL